MAATKSTSTPLNAVTTTQTSSVVTISDAYDSTAFVEIVQVGTATTAASVLIQLSTDNSKWYDFRTYTAGLTAATYTGGFDLLRGALYVRFTFTQQAGGTSSTCTVQVGEVTA